MNLLTIYLHKLTGSTGHSYNADWDSKVIALLDEGELISVDRHCAHYLYKGDAYSVWLMPNGVFALGSSFYIKGEHVDYKNQRMPSAKTMLRLHREVYEPWAKAQCKSVDEIYK